MKKVMNYVIVLTVLIFLSVFLLIYADKGNGSNRHVYLNIDCDGLDVSGNYKVGDRFKCKLSGEEFIIKINKISRNVVYFKIDNYGLTEVTSTGIDLLTKEDEFSVKKDNELELALQATDVNSSIKISFK